MQTITTASQLTRRTQFNTAASHSYFVHVFISVFYPITRASGNRVSWKEIMCLKLLAMELLGDIEILRVVPLTGVDETLIYFKEIKKD
jgi:hypothetical protein